jgi:hypothetical protein
MYSGLPSLRTDREVAKGLWVQLRSWHRLGTLGIKRAAGRRHYSIASPAEVTPQLEWHDLKQLPDAYAPFVSV